LGNHPLLDSVFQAFNEAGIRWCLLREPAQADLPKGDIDLLVHSHDSLRSREALAALDFVRLPARGYDSDTFHLAYHPPSNHWIWLHITTELVFGPYRTMRTDAAVGCLERRRRAPDCPQREKVWLLAPDDAFWALMLHCLLDKGGIPDRHRATLQELAKVASADSALARVFAQHSPPGSSTTVLGAARLGDWPALNRLAPAMRADETTGRVATVSTLRIITRLEDARRRGLLVALLGPDGAGKSTLSRGIRESFFFPVRFVYMGVGTGGLSRLAARLTIFHRPPFTYFAFVSTLWVRYLTGLFYRWQGRLVIFDRYTYDALLPMPGGVSTLKRRALDIQAWICPPPDLILILDVPGEVMFQRKGEFSSEHLEAQRQMLLSLKQRLPSVEVIDGTQPLDAVRSDAIQRIWRRYASRLQTL
jgi:thymidylate kinase